MTSNTLLDDLHNSTVLYDLSVNATNPLQVTEPIGSTTTVTVAPGAAWILTPGTATTQPTGARRTLGSSTTVTLSGIGGDYSIDLYFPPDNSAPSASATTTGAPAANAIRLATVSWSGTAINSITDLRPFDFGGPDLTRLNILDYGADPGGTIPCDNAFKAALATLYTVGGGTVYCPPGTYRLDNKLVFPNSAVLPTTPGAIGSTKPKQPYYRLCGAASPSGQVGTRLNLNYTGPQPNVSVSGVTITGGQATTVTITATILYGSFDVGSPLTISAGTNQETVNVTSITVTGTSITCIGFTPLLSYSGTLTLTWPVVNDAKIISLGTGEVEIDHLDLWAPVKDTGQDAIPFILITNTRPELHHLSIQGSWNATGTSPQSVNSNQWPTQAGIILGGVQATVDGSTSSGYAGYGGRVYRNLFWGVHYAIIGQSQFTTTAIESNYVTSACGSNSNLGAGFGFWSKAFAANSNTVSIRDNQIEVVNYQQPIRIGMNTRLFTLDGNQFPDAAGFGISAAIVASPTVAPAAVAEHTGTGMLASGTYYVALTALDSAGVESAPGPVASVTMGTGQNAISVPLLFPTLASQINVYAGTSATSVYLQNSQPLPLGTASYELDLLNATNPAPPAGPKFTLPGYFPPASAAPYLQSYLFALDARELAEFMQLSAPTLPATTTLAADFTTPTPTITVASTTGLNFDASGQGSVPGSVILIDSTKPYPAANNVSLSSVQEVAVITAINQPSKELTLAWKTLYGHLQGATISAGPFTYSGVTVMNANGSKKSGSYFGTYHGVGARLTPACFGVRCDAGITILGVQNSGGRMNLIHMLTCDAAQPLLDLDGTNVAVLSDTKIDSNLGGAVLTNRLTIGGSGSGNTLELFDANANLTAAVAGKDSAMTSGISQRSLNLYGVVATGSGSFPYGTGYYDSPSLGLYGSFWNGSAGNKNVGYQLYTGMQSASLTGSRLYIDATNTGGTGMQNVLTLDQNGNLTVKGSVEITGAAGGGDLFRATDANGNITLRAAGIDTGLVQASSRFVDIRAVNATAANAKTNSPLLYLTGQYWTTGPDKTNLAQWAIQNQMSGLAAASSNLVFLPPTGGPGVLSLTPTGTLIYLDGANFQFGTGTGSQIGTAATQKLAFYGASPVAQPVNTSDIRQALIDLGLLASGGVNPLNLNGGALTSGTIAVAAATTTTTLGTQSGNATQVPTKPVGYLQMSINGANYMIPYFNV